MPNWFSNLSLRAKFVAVTMLVGMVVTAFATISFLIYANSATRSNLVREMTALAQVLAENSSAALVFNDPTAAAQTLTALRVKPDVIGARVVRTSGDVFAQFGQMLPDAGDAVTAGSLGAQFGENHLLVKWPILLDGDSLGSVELLVSLDVLRNERNALILIAGVIVIFSTLIAFALSTTLQRALIRPITHLAGVMHQVSSEKAYARRAVRETNDELGDLITGFNHMLEQIETQHRELMVYREQLERLVDDRTTQLQDANVRLHQTVADLQESKSELESANRFKSEFLANMSHELRTPLNAIIGFSDIMVNQLFGKLGDARYEDYAKDIHYSANHLIEIIGDILDTTRIEFGKLELQEATVSVDGLLEDALRIISPSIHAQRIKLEQQALPLPGPKLRCDPIRVRQILINLLSNAVKFTDPGGAISIGVKIRDGIEITITDTGIGIDEADLERVVTPFAQVEHAFARKYQGTGLGLSLSKTLMECHQGKLTLSSRLGEGTAVTIYFPAFRMMALDSDVAQSDAAVGEFS
ncbi:sensor/response regulator hybrid [alpha proteobacterium BAL199]|jgi:signal transduction histidine kinase|nr:sensor/response regulator hybrid [alpha proteobacterium BAL199]